MKFIKKLEPAVTEGKYIGFIVALKFALEYPERTKSLIMVGSGSPCQEELEGATGLPNFILNDFIFKIVLLKPGAGKRYLVLIELENIEVIEPINIDKSNYGNMDDWLLVEEIKNVTVG